MNILTTTNDNKIKGELNMVQNRKKFAAFTDAQNRNSHLLEVKNSRQFYVETSDRDEGTLKARANLRERTDTLRGRSLTGLTISLDEGATRVKLTGREARTLYRLLRKAAVGYSD
jgi:hypothetical protein